MRSILRAFYQKILYSLRAKKINKARKRLIQLSHSSQARIGDQTWSREELHDR